MIDEADEAMPGQSAARKRQSVDSPPGSPGPRKRKPGPLPKDFVRRPFTPPPEVPEKPFIDKENGNTGTVYYYESPLPKINRFFKSDKSLKIMMFA